MKSWMYFVLGGFVGIIGFLIPLLYFYYDYYGEPFTDFSRIFLPIFVLWIFCGLVSLILTKIDKQLIILSLTLSLVTGCFLGYFAFSLLH